MSCAKSVAGSTFGQQQQQTQQKHAKNQQQKFTKAAASQTNSSKNQTLTTTTAQTVNCSQATPAPSSSKSPTLTSPIATATYMASSNCSSSSFSFESGVVLSGSSGCSSLSNSPTSSSSSNPYLASLGVPTSLPTEGSAAVGNAVCENNASHLDESFSSTSCILNSSLLAAVNGDLEDESKIMSQSLSDTLCSSQNKSDTLQINEDNSGQQQLLLENMNHHHHPQLSVAENTCLNTEDARTLQLAVELTMLNLNQMPSPTPPAAATSSSSPSTTTTTNNFEHLLQQPHRLHSPLDQPYSSSYTSVSNPYHMTTKVFLQTQSQAAAATLLNQKFLSDTSLSNSPTKLNTLPNHNQTLGGTVVTIDDRSKKSQNMTECVPVPSSEHVAEIVGRQGCKIKALRAKTNTYIKTPVRNEEPVFVVTGRKEDVAKAKREILSAAEHFTLIRATRRTNDGISACVAGLGGGGGLGAGGGHLVSFNKNSLSSATPLPGQITIQVRVPYRVVGLVVGPKGNTIKHIQHETQTYIVTPSRDKQPIFEVTGMPDNVEMARKQIEAHIATRTGNTLNNSLAIPAPPPPPPPPPAPAGTLNQLSDTIASTQASLQSLNALNQILNDDLHSEILSSIYKNGIGSALEYSQIGANVTNTTNNRCHNSNPFNCGFVGEINPTVLSVNDIQRRILNAGKSNVNMQLNCTDFINNLIDSNAVSQFASESNTNFPQLAHNTNTIRNLKSVINTINLLENSSNGDTGTLQQQNCPTTNALLTRSCSSASSTASSSKSFNNGNNPQYWKSVNSSTIPANKACGNGVVSGNDSLDIDEGIGDSPLYSWGLPNALAALTNSYCSPASTSISPTDSLFGEHHVNSKNAVIQNQQYIGSAKAKLLEKLKRSNCWMCQDKDIVAVLLPCGHKMFCMECANRLCQQNEASCPVCSTQVKYYQSVRIHN